MEVARSSFNLESNIDPTNVYVFEESQKGAGQTAKYQEKHV